MTEKQANVQYIGPTATHDAGCPIYGCPNKAVLEFGSPGVFQPCWSCQKEGFETIQATGWFGRWLQGRRKRAPSERQLY